MYMSKKEEPKFSCGGMWGTRFHGIWKNMKARCLRPDTEHVDRKSYNGIMFEDRWVEFLNFKEDMYEKYLQHVEEYGEKETTLDRVDGSKGYSKANCRWATRAEQTNNRKNVKLYTFKGKTMNLKQWANELGMHRSVLASRVEKDWPIEKILSNERFYRNK